MPPCGGLWPTTATTGPALISCEVKGTSPALADQIANIAQSDDTGIAITMPAQNQRRRVGIIGAPPSEFKDYAPSARRMLTRVGVAIAEVTVRLDAAAHTGKTEQPGRGQHQRRLPPTRRVPPIRRQSAIYP